MKQTTYFNYLNSFRRILAIRLKNITILLIGFLLIFSFNTIAQTGYFEDINKKDAKKAFLTAKNNANSLARASNWTPEWTSNALFEADYFESVKESFTLVGTLGFDNDTGIVTPDKWLLLDEQGTQIWAIDRHSHQVIAANNSILLANEQEIIAIELKSGKTLWSLPLTSSFFKTTKNHIYTIAKDKLSVYENISGKLLGQQSLSTLGFNAKDQLNILLTAQEIIVTSSNKLASFDLTLEGVNWSTENAHPTAQFITHQNQLLAYQIHELIAYEIKTGIKKWNFLFDKDSILHVQPNANQILIQTIKRIDSWTQTGLYSLDLKLGSKIWEFLTPYQIKSEIIPYGNNLFFSDTYRILKFNKEDGKVEAELPLPFVFRTTPQFWDQLYLKNKKLYLFRPPIGLLAFDLSTKQQLWYFPLPEISSFRFEDRNKSTSYKISNGKNSSNSNIVNTQIKDAFDLYDKHREKTYQNSLRKATQQGIGNGQIAFAILEMKRKMWKQEQIERANNSFAQNNSSLSGLNSGYLAKENKALHQAAANRFATIASIANTQYSFPFWGNYFIHPIQLERKNYATGFLVINLLQQSYKHLLTAPGVPLRNTNLKRYFYLDFPAFSVDSESEQLLLADVGLIATNFNELNFKKVLFPDTRVYNFDLAKLMAEDQPIPMTPTNKEVVKLLSNPVFLLNDDRAEQLLYLLETDSINLNDTENGISLLYALIARSVPTARNDSLVSTPIEYFINYLLDKKVDLNIGVNKEQLKQLSFPDITPFYLTEDVLRYSTPLLLATAIGDYPLITKLLAYGADPESSNYHGEKLKELIDQQKLKEGNKFIHQLQDLLSTY